MQIVLLISVLAALVWSAICARHVSLLMGALVTLMIGYVLGHSFWNIDLGPVPLTLDRLALVGLVGVFALRYRSGQLSAKPLQGADWLLLCFLTIVSISAVTSGGGPVRPDSVSPMWRLIAAFWMPAVLYFIVREAALDRRSWRFLLLGMSGFGVYLAVTAFAEMTGRWSFVFPRYISDPTLGLHFGRARGPALNSVSLGVYLTVCLWCAWSLRGEVSRRWQVLLLLTLPLMAGGIFATYTRSTWLGLAASASVVGWVTLPRRWRWPAMTATLAAGLVVITVCWGQLIGLRREGSAQESQHSVQQRAAFAYVSWQMFQDHPMFGVGLGRFFDRKLPYLADRSQQFELESIRGLQHHNTFLAMLTETGMIGLAAFLALLVAWCRTAWSMVCDPDRPAWVQAHGLLMLAVMVAYLPTALFHDITHLQAEQWLLFMMAGVTAGLSTSAVRRADAADPAALTGELEKTPATFSSIHAIPHPSGSSTHEFAVNLAKKGNVVASILSGSSARGRVVGHDRIERPASAHNAISSTSIRKERKDAVYLFGMQIDRLTMPAVTARVADWCRQPRGFACRYVVTPNVDHVVMHQERQDLQAVYREASLVVADGTPVVWASRLLGSVLPERVAGSDLVPRLLQEASSANDRRLRIFLLGAAPGVADRAAERIARAYPGVEVTGTYSPPLGFESDSAANKRILSRIAEARPDLLIVGLGAPKQELWVHAHQRQIQAKVALCVGATIDFLAGEKQRSPVWMRHLGMEWLHRVLSEPRRLTSRYARDAWIFPQLVWQELRGQKA